MPLRDDIPAILEYARGAKQLRTLEHNAKLFEVYEGDLASQVLEDLKKQLSAQSYEQVQHRIAPVNVLRRLVSKLSALYQVPPARWLVKEVPADAELFSWYEKTLAVDTVGGLFNEFFNLFKNSLLEPYLRNGKPALRVIPSDRFLPYSKDVTDPTQPTHILKFMGTIQKTSINSKGGSESRPVQLIYAYTDTEFLPFDSDGEIKQDILNAAGNPLGLNPYGKLPFVYVNRSKHQIVPTIDTDTLRMVKLFPILLSDLNFAVMYQAFSIVYGIDVDDQNITMSPNAFWRFKSDPASGAKTPQIGVIKPTVDIAEVVGFIMAQLSFWLQSRNIRPGQVGAVTTENFASGVSKLVDEMDTFDDRQKQVPYFQDAETELWNLILHHMHPVWVREGAIENRQQFSAGQSVEVEFPPQQPMVRREDTIANVKSELELQLLTRRDALIRLNPGMSEDDADVYLVQIEQDNTVIVAGEEPAQSAHHIHALPEGGTTGMDEPSGTGHLHAIDGGNTSVEDDSPGHTHSLPDGTETGPPIAA